jgi:hypothetical protein
MFPGFALAMPEIHHARQHSSSRPEGATLSSTPSNELQYSFEQLSVGRQADMAEDHFYQRQNQKLNLEPKHHLEIFLTDFLVKKIQKLFFLSPKNVVQEIFLHFSS